MRIKLIVPKTKQRGFTLMEVLVATILLLTGIVAVAQLVPVAVNANNGNRRDSTAAVIAQRQLTQFLQLPVTFPGPYLYTDPNGNIISCNLGDPTQPGVTVGSPVINTGSRPSIDFSAAKVAGYNFTTTADPEDPYKATYDVRWAVITAGNGTSATSRRFIIAARQVNVNSFVLPLTLDAMVQR